MKENKNTIKNIDLWLYPGCLCRCWNDHIRCEKKLMIFGKIGYLVFDHYHPIGTPWDFAPDNAKFININSGGVCSFQESEEDASYITDKWLQLPYLIFWRECPEHLKGKILPRPEWAKEKEWKAALNT